MIDNKIIDLGKTEQEREFYNEKAHEYSQIFLSFNTIEYYGLEKIIREGPAIISPNHVGSAKDILTLVDIFLEEDTQIFFATREDMFNSQEWYNVCKAHLKKHLRIFSHLVPDKRVKEFAKNTGPYLERLGMIPFDIQNKKNNLKSIRAVEQYLTEYGRKVVVFQFDKEKRKTDKHSLFHGANKGTAFMAHRVYKNHGIVVPVYPTGILGSHGLVPWDYMITTFKRKPIRVSFGDPLEITSYLNEKNPVKAMTSALDASIWRTLVDLSKNKKQGKIIYPALPR